MLINILLNRVLKYIDDIKIHMVAHATFGVVFDNKQVQRYHGNFPQFYKNLRYFKAGKKCVSVPKYDSLRKLDVSDSKIRKIPALPDLKFLNIQKTSISELPFLPKLEILYCDIKKIRLNLYRYPKLKQVNEWRIRNR